jgi:2-haloacid dehalogenase
MTSTPRIDAVAFDAYGTLFDVFSVTALCDRLFPGRGDALARLWRTKQLQYSLLRSLMERFEDFWQITADSLEYATAQLDLPLGDAGRRQLLDAYLRLAPFPDVKPGLEALQARGVRRAILSNGSRSMLDAAVAHGGLTPLIDDIVSVDDVKVFKPSPRVYQLLPARLHTPLDRIAFVSSNSWDVHGAASAGLHTFWIQRDAAEPQERLGFPAAHVVHAIGDVARWMD